MSLALLGRLTIVVAVIALPLLGQESSGETASAATLNAPINVSGQVIDDITGKPLRGATVRFTTMEGRYICLGCDKSILPPAPELDPPREILTSDDGRFEFDNVPAAAAYIVARKKGYLDAWPIHRRVDDRFGNYSPSDLATPIVLRLAPAASIYGIFRDSQGTVIAKDASITLWRLTNWSGWPRLEYGGFATFDKTGAYHFDDLGPGQYYLFAMPPNAHRGPQPDANGNLLGEVPVWYPATTDEEPHTFLTLREGQHAEIDFRFPKRKLHHISCQSKENHFCPYDMLDASGRNVYSHHQSTSSTSFEWWLPDGTYRPSTGNDLTVIEPPLLEIAGSGMPDLSVSIALPQRVEVPVEITDLSPHGSLCPTQGTLCYFLSARMLRVLPDGYVEVTDELSQTGQAEGIPPKRVEHVSLIPGSYTVSIASSGNLYAKSIMSGTSNLAVEPLVIKPDDAPEPIEITLAEGAMADGVVLRDGKPAAAWVYAVAEDIQSKADFRELQAALAKADGKFHIEGLAPGFYLFVASEFELRLNVHDAADLAPWKPRAKIVRVEAGKTTSLMLPLTDYPDQP